MTPSQMLQRRVPKADCCTAPAANDFALGAKLTPYACVKQKTCPVCGSKGTASHYKTPNEDLVFFYCLEDEGHKFEVDELTGSCDRVGS